MKRKNGRISEDLKKRIQVHCRHMQEKNLLLGKAREGTLRMESIEIYLHNAFFFFHHTPLHLRRAEAMALKRGEKELADFFHEKIGEENGHENWPRNDLKNLGMGVVEKADLNKLTAGTFRLLAHAKRIIDWNPVLFIPYMLYLEQITVLVTPAFLKDLKTNLSIPPEFMSAIFYHADLDQKHVEEDIFVMDKFSHLAEDKDLMEALDLTAQYLDELTNECVNGI